MEEASGRGTGRDDGHRDKHGPGGTGEAPGSYGTGMRQQDRHGTAGMAHGRYERAQRTGTGRDTRERSNTRHRHTAPNAGYTKKQTWDRHRAKDRHAQTRKGQARRHGTGTHTQVRHRHGTGTGKAQTGTGQSREKACYPQSLR